MYCMYTSKMNVISKKNFLQGKGFGEIKGKLNIIILC